jgi:hypothetical protein
MELQNLNRNLTIGCLPNSLNLLHPADRRRYVPFFRDLHLNFEVADFNKYYDILIISINSDIEKWATYKNINSKINKKTRIIFDLSDLYLKENTFKDIFRAFYYFFTGRISKFSFSYKKSIIKMIASTDVLLCGSIEQKKYLNNYHKNVIVVRDFFDDDIKLKKYNYSLLNNQEVNILWEGLSHGNKEIFYLLKNILIRLNNFKVNIHIITDPTYCEIGTKYLCKSTYDVIDDIFKSTQISYFVYPWNPLTFSSIATKCDLALLPIPDNEIMVNKPENKLLFLLSHGIPTITSDTPSYKRVLNQIGVNYYCSNIDDWKIKIENLLKTDFNRIDYINKANDYISCNASKKVIYNTWNHILFD